MNYLRAFALVLVATVGWAGISVGYEGGGVGGEGGLVVNGLVMGGVAWGAGGGGGDNSSLVIGLNALLNVMYALLTPLLMLAGWLLTPDWAFGEIFGLRPVLHDLWILISNIVYIIFAFLLVAMAFMNIFGAEWNTWAIRAKLPKLIVGIISVPFTWFFVSAIVSLSSVLTASAIQLAGDLAPSNNAEFEMNIPKKCTMNFNATAAGTGTSATPTTGGTPATSAAGWATPAKPGTQFLTCETPKGKTQFKDLFKSDSAFGIVSYYAYGVFKIDKYKEITGLNLSSVQTVVSLGVNMIIAIIMFVMFFLIIIALVFSLFTRALYFWAIAVFSPLLSLRYFFDGKLGVGDSWLSVTKIVGLGMVPVYVAAALSFGLLFTAMVSSSTLQAGTPQKSQYFEIKDDGIKMFDTEFTVIGTPVGTTPLADLKKLGGGFIGQLAIQIAALCILWFAVMAALKSSEVTAEASKPVADFGWQLGGIIKSLPKYAPIIPTGHGMASMSNLGNISSKIGTDLEQKVNARGFKMGESISQALGISSEASRRLTAASQNLASNLPQSKAQNVPMFEKFVADTKMTVEQFKDKAYQDQLRVMVDRSYGVDPKQKEELKKIIETGTLKEFLEKYADVAGDGPTKLNMNEVDEFIKISNGTQAPSGASTVSPAATPAASVPVTAVNINVNNKPIEMHSLAPAAGAPVTQLTKESMDKLSTEVAAATSGLAAGSDLMKAELSKIQAALKEGLTKIGITNSDQQNAILNKIRPGLGLPPTVDTKTPSKK